MRRPLRQIDPARRDDPIYVAHESALMAQEFLLMTYGITHFEPEIHLPIVKNNPDDPGIRQMCDALRRLMQEAAPLGEIRTGEDVQKFRRENLGEVVVTSEEAKVARISALQVALFALSGATITFLFAPARTPIMFILAVALFIYVVYPACSLWWAWFDTLGRRYYREYGPLSIFRKPTLKEALEVSGAFSVRPLSLRLAVVVCAVLVLNWLHPSR
ncbi:hypothetical protein PILCRDRAFT_8563 [Piloderma croceum F 1598]|uniref:Uncharacterized protein n=1 Tax=Piloderma croceum (strain F 1598) TaxID=765440 RepID=A0A0C3BVU1_PILCF|nr:hypothetical protein PILCRDRAFT_8563 [Piloderma croceum F 1598]